MYYLFDLNGTVIYDIHGAKTNTLDSIGVLFGYGTYDEQDKLC